MSTSINSLILFSSQTIYSPPETDIRITDDSEIRITDDGNVRITD